jgi:hypothetical protein
MNDCSIVKSGGFLMAVLQEILGAHCSQQANHGVSALIEIFLSRAFHECRCRGLSWIQECIFFALINEGEFHASY